MEQACAHLRVLYETKVADGLTTGWWECALGCGARFIPAALVARPAQRAGETGTWFSKGTWIYGPTGQTFTAEDLDEIVRQALTPPPSPEAS
jgi:hypothetical protein